MFGPVTDVLAETETDWQGLGVGRKNLSGPVFVSSRCLVGIASRWTLTEQDGVRSKYSVSELDRSMPCVILTFEYNYSGSVSSLHHRLVL